MHISIDIWKSLAGIAIFLLGMNFLEEGLRHLAGRSFKLFLKKQTSHKLKAIGGGAIVTAILQSSSIVNLMVLAFAGAGILQMQNALAIILGANLGTTLTSWLIATVGFSYNIENFALPIAAVSGIMMMLVNKESRLYQWCKLLFGFSFLFIGLSYIKTGIENIVQHVDISSFNEQPAILFLFAGFLITSLIQSSSATVAIALSALNVNAIDLISATALVLGAEVGTSIKLIIASLNGLAIKKRVATGNLLFNITSTLLVFIFLLPINRFITDVIGIKDNLLALVLFQSLVNIAGIVIFYPFLGVFGRFLDKRFISRDDEALYISKAPITDSGLAMDALEKESANFIDKVLGFTANAFNADYKPPTPGVSRNYDRKPLKEKYEYIKTLHGEILRFSAKLQIASLSKNETEKLGQLISANRNSMYAAKNIWDALHDIDQLSKSSNDIKYSFFEKNKEKITIFCHFASELLEKKNNDGIFEDITAVYKKIQKEYSQNLEELYKEGMEKHVTQVEISTLINFNREMHTAFKSFVFALKDYLLSPKEAKYFDELPGFIR